MFLELSCGHVVKFPLLMADRNVWMMGNPAIPCMNLVSFFCISLGHYVIKMMFGWCLETPYFVDVVSVAFLHYLSFAFHLHLVWIKGNFASVIAALSY